MSSFALYLRQWPDLLCGIPATLEEWLAARAARRVGFCVTVIIAGAGAYGAALGSWRAGEQAVYTAIKLPLILILTACGNALLNGMLAPLLGLKLGFRQSFLAILMSFAFLATILGAFSPILYFAILNLPSLAPNTPLPAGVYPSLLLLLVAMMAYAGAASNLRLRDLLRAHCHNPSLAWRVLFSWLAGNLMLGSQLAWILRPFVGSPELTPSFLRPDAMEGNFFEAVLQSVSSILTSLTQQYYL